MSELKKRMEETITDVRAEYRSELIHSLKLSLVYLIGVGCMGWALHKGTKSDQKIGKLEERIDWLETMSDVAKEMEKEA